MKLHLVIAVVICMKVAAANLTSDVGNHGQLVADAAQRGTRISRHLRSDVAKEFAEEVNKAFANIKEQHFAYEGGAKMDATVFANKMKEAKDLSFQEQFKILNLRAEDKNLLRNPVFLQWLLLRSEVHYYPKFKFAYKILKNAHGIKFLENTVEGDVAAVVKAVNAGLIDSDSESRNLAKVIEDKLLKELQANEVPAVAFFEKLKLNDIMDEYELYGNPAFRTWLRYVNRKNNGVEGGWVGDVYDVFSQYEHLKSFKGVAAYGKLSLEEPISEAAIEWQENMKHLEQQYGATSDEIPSSTDSQISSRRSHLLNQHI